MSSPHTKSQHNGAQPQDTIVEADPDPNAARAAQLDSEDSEDAEFAQAEADFARKERLHARHLVEEGKVAEGEQYAHDAIDRMRDANTIMAHVQRGDAEVDRLRDAKHHELSLAVREMPDQSLMTLRDAVSAVRAYAENLTEGDVRKLSRVALLSEDVIEQKRQIILTTGVNIEITLNSVEQVRRDPYSLVRELVTFTTVAMELASHLPKLLDLINEFGRVLLQFRF